MNVRVYKQIFIFTIIALILTPLTALGENIETDSIELDRHWIYLYQQDDLKTFEVNEYFLINNTGETVFNGSILISIQNNSIIAEKYCNGTLNMACRYNITGCGECFYLKKIENTNFFTGYPFLGENRLSYYGQRKTISITAFSTTNTSLKNETLNLNATIGGSSLSRNQEIQPGIGVHITSENLDVGMTPLIATYTPFNITTFENITIFNNGSDTESINFIISNLSNGWTVEICNNTRKINNISLSPQEYQNLTLKITAPSNIASIYVSYTTSIDSNDTKGIFTKQYLYKTKKVTFYVYLLSIDELDISLDLEMVHDELFWLEEYGRYWFIARNEQVIPNSYSSISMHLKKTIDSQSDTYLIVVAFVLLILIIIILLLKKIDFFTRKGKTQKQGFILEEKRTPIKEKAKNIQELEVQKRKVLLAIKRVENEFKDKTINKEDYEHFRTAYKKRAIEILKEIDRLKELKK